MEYSSIALSLKPSATLQLSAKANELKRSGRDIISLSAGQPDFPTPDPISQAGIDAIRNGKTGYTASTGIPELKTAIAEEYSRRRNIVWSSGNVLVGCGAKHNLANLVKAAVDEGDKVLLPKPYWVSYPEMVKAAGAVPVYPFDVLDGSAVREAAENGAVGVIINYPSNPAGLIPSSQEMRELSDAVADTGMWVISDDIYEDLAYTDDGVPHILDEHPELTERVAVVSGVSKTYAMTGWRIGYSLANQRWTGLAGILQAHSTSNPCSISQWAALAALSGKAELERKEMHKCFHERRDLICQLLSEEDGLEFAKPDGAFYVFARLLDDSAKVDTNRFCSELLDKEGLAVIPGSAFGAEGYIRISFAASSEDIRSGVERLRSFLHGRSNR